MKINEMRAKLQLFCLTSDLLVFWGFREAKAEAGPPPLAKDDKQGGAARLAVYIPTHRKVHDEWGTGMSCGVGRKTIGFADAHLIDDEAVAKVGTQAWGGRVTRRTSRGLRFGRRRSLRGARL